MVLRAVGLSSIVNSLAVVLLRSSGASGSCVTGCSFSLLVFSFLFSLFSSFLFLCGFGEGSLGFGVVGVGLGLVVSASSLGGGVGFGLVKGAASSGGWWGSSGFLWSLAGVGLLG